MDRSRFKSSPFCSLILVVNTCDSTGFTQGHNVYTEDVGGSIPSPPTMIYLDFLQFVEVLWRFVELAEPPTGGGSNMGMAPFIQL